MAAGHRPADANIGQVVKAGTAAEKMDIGHVIQRGFATFGSQPLFFVGLSLLMAGLPHFLGQYQFERTGAGTGSWFFASSNWMVSLPTWVLSNLLHAVLLYCALSITQGREASPGACLAAGLRLTVGMTLLSAMTALLYMVGFVLLVVPGVIFATMFAVAAPAMVEERIGPLAGLGRSRALTKGLRWPILLLLILFGLAYLGLLGLAGFVVGLSGAGDAAGAKALLAASTSIAAAALSAPMLASLYVELRSMKEGDDPTDLVAIFE
jgi:hypothetical protein